MKIDHGQATDLETRVRQVYGCERSGLCGLVEAGLYESDPLEAAILCVAKLGATVSPKSVAYQKADEFIDKWRTIFRYPDENEGYTFEEYLKDLDEVIALLNHIEQ